MNYANYLASIEPYNYQCKIIGFDTFSGGVGVSKKDENNYSFERKDGEYFADTYEDLLKSIEIFNLDRPIDNIEKIKLVKGDIEKLQKNILRKIHRLQLNFRFNYELLQPTLCALKVSILEFLKVAL